MSRITIHDVSKAAGVSIKTVSRVLNSEPNVRSETRARVLKLVEELNYHPSLSARSLAGRSSNLIGLIYQNPSANYVVDLQKGALERCHTRGYRLLVHPCEGNDLSSVRDLAGLVLESHLDGVVLAPPLSDSTEVLAELQKHRIRFVRIAPTVDLDAYSCVFMNDVAAAREMTEYLIALGHERIGFINGPAGHPVTEQRYLGYTLALRSHGLDVDPQLVDRGEFTFDSGLAAARRLLSRATRPTAVFASNDDMAAGTIMAAHEMGLTIPQPPVGRGLRRQLCRAGHLAAAHHRAPAHLRDGAPGGGHAVPLAGRRSAAEERGDSLPHGVPRVDRAASGELEGLQSKRSLLAEPPRETHTTITTHPANPIARYTCIARRTSSSHLRQ